MEGIQGVVLAGGRGSRMDLLCSLRAKPTLPFAGRLRVVDFVLTNCVRSQIKNMTVMVDYQRDHMADYLGQWGAANAGLTNIFVLQPEAGSYAGTADAVYQNLSYLNAQSGDKLLVLAGDHIYRMDYRDMIAFHEKVNADATVGVIRVPIEEAHRFGTVVTDAQGRIQEFVEKSSSPSSNLASMGIYVFNKDVISKRLVEDAGKSDSPHDFGYAILPEMVKHDRVFAYEFNGYWQDIGTVEAYYQANMELLVSRPRFSLDSNWPILGEYSALPALTESADGNILNSLISPGCIIKGRVENSILSPGVRVEEQAIIRNSVIMANASVGYHSVIDNCILDEGVHVGQSCYIGFGSGLLPGNWDITVLGKDVIVPAHTAIGRKCKVLPKAGPGDFTASLIPAGTMVPA